MIAVISYKAGNLASVQHALNRGQIPYYLAKYPEELDSGRWDYFAWCRPCFLRNGFAGRTAAH